MAKHASPPGEHFWQPARRGPLPWVVGAVGLAALGVGQLVPLRHHMEADLRSRSQTALRAAGLSGVVVDVTGRDALLTGTVPSAADGDRALRSVRDVNGMRVAEADLRVGAATAAPTPSPSPSPPPSPSPSPSVPPSPKPSRSPAPKPGSGGSAATARSQLAALPQITFTSGSTRLTPAGRAVVRRAAAILRVNPALRARVEGYSDDVGDWDANKALSTARAASVRTALAAAGVPASRITTFGWSEEHPLVPNTSPANRALNRRATVTTP